ncbi:MAG TPA: hypothetical protein VIH24_04180 [Candidatus Limnocylindria bacterium]|jgi:hypothetical protein
MSETAVRLAAPIILVVALAAGILVDANARFEASATDRAAATRFDTVLDGLTPDSLVLVGFDADFGTYAEIRPSVRTLLADLLARDARLAFVSLTPEGRALALAERDRLMRLDPDLEADRIGDLGFLPGSEAALVTVARAIDGGAALGPPSDPVDLAETGLVLVVGGNDLGPRSWVEQVVPRIGPIPMVAVTPTILLPEVQPYLASGQLAALIATPIEGAAYRDDVAEATGGRLGELGGPSTLAVGFGLAIGIVWLLLALVRRMASSRPAREADRA